MSSHRKRRRSGRKKRLYEEELSVEGAPPGEHDRREPDRIHAMRRLARSGAPMDLLWAIQKNQLRQHQIVFCNRQHGAQQHTQVQELQQDILLGEQTIGEQAGEKWAWLLEEYCRAPCSHAATMALTRELYIVQQELLRQQELNPL